MAAGVEEVGGHRPRVHHGDPDVVRRQLDGEGLGQPHLGELGGRVQRLQGSGHAPGDRGHHGDVAPPPLDHPGQDGPEQVGGAEPVDPGQALDLVGIGGGEGAVGPDAGVGHHDVHRSQGLLHPCDGVGHLGGVGHVGGDGHAPVADERQHLVEVGGGPGHQPHTCSPLGGLPHHLATDAPRGPGDEGHRPVPLHRFGSLMARSARMFFCTSVVPAPIDV
jgi:hypothetical protein